MTNAVIATFTGQRVDLLAPDPATLVIEDIAHHLALLNRFVGATRQPYSVAQHSVLVSYCCEPEDALHGLLHDAAEAYLGEMTRPLKQLAVMASYRAMEAQLQIVIYIKFGLTPATPESVTRMDEQLAATEAADLFRVGAAPAWAFGAERLRLSGEPIEPWAPCCAEDEFLRRFRQLTNEGHRLMPPPRIWVLHCPFRKSGSPVLGTFGANVQPVVIMRLETWKQLCQDVPQLQTTQFEVGTFDDGGGD